MTNELYFAPSYFTPYYFASLGLKEQPPSIPGTPAISYRDRDAYAAIITLLENTGEFALVTLGSLIEKASLPTDRLPLAAILPRSWHETDDVDPVEILRQVGFDIILIARANDPAEALDEVQRLSVLVQRAIDGSSLGGGCLPALTIIKEGRMDRRRNRHPEQKFVLKGEFSYIPPTNHL